MEKRITQSDKNIPDGITCEHILKAVKDYEEDIIEHSFIDSRDYDVIINDEKYPPKAIIGLASRYLIDRPLAPSEFSAGLDKKCFKVLKELGFDVIPKSLISGSNLWLRTLFNFDITTISFKSVSSIISFYHYIEIK